MCEFLCNRMNTPSRTISGDEEDPDALRTSAEPNTPSRTISRDEEDPHALRTSTEPRSRQETIIEMENPNKARE